MYIIVYQIGTIDDSGNFKNSEDYIEYPQMSFDSPEAAIGYLFNKLNAKYELTSTSKYKAVVVDAEEFKTYKNFFNQARFHTLGIHSKYLYLDTLDNPQNNSL